VLHTAQLPAKLRTSLNWFIMTDSSDKTFFTAILQQQKEQFDAVIKDYWAQEMPRVQHTYGEASVHAVSALADIMQRGGKRIRASLAEQSYRMFGGTDQTVIEQMGLTLEMIHAYLLIIDDVSDQSDVRRGGQAAHRLLEAWHEQATMQGNAEHFGASMATLAAMTGAHMAIARLAALPVEAERRTAAIENLNRLLAVTCHGQINDVFNQATATHDPEMVGQVLLWKTAYYSFVNPLQLGAILAGAPHATLDALEDYGQAAGRAFQISDDIIGLFGDSDATGKNTTDDLREGKRTLLVLKALEQADEADTAFLESQLGNSQLAHADFERCQQIIRGSGALDIATQELASSCDKARQSLREGILPAGDGMKFLAGLTDYLRDRTS
jgi:geranylgeranyl diphosphate synthase type I